MIGPLVIRQGELAEEGILPLFADPTLNQLLLAAFYIVFFEDAVDLLLTWQRSLRVHVTRTQILHDIAREFFVCLVPPRQRFEDDPIGQMRQDLGIKARRLDLFTSQGIQAQFHLRLRVSHDDSSFDVAEGIEGSAELDLIGSFPDRDRDLSTAPFNNRVAAISPLGFDEDSDEFQAKLGSR